MPDSRLSERGLRRRAQVGALVVMVAASLWVQARSPRPEFFRGINLNGPPVVIDGNLWEGGDSKRLSTRDSAFENQAIPLIPPTDPERARMIRSSRWNGQAELTLTDIPSGDYSVYLFVWEDNNSETFSISLNGREVLHDFESGPAGTWKRLGPWRVVVETGSFRLSTRGGAANLSGIEIWRGEIPISESEPPKPRSRELAASRGFDAEIAPILAKHCLECHGRSVRKGKLALMSEASALAGGASGPAIVPGKLDESLLWDYVESGEMPRERPKLSDVERETLKRWIQDGAKWGTPEIDPFLATTDRRAGYDWWSLQPVRKPDLPAVRDSGWAKNAIDRFVLARLEGQGLRPAAEADRRTLIRRLYFDLIGLPPEPEAVDRFLADPREQAYGDLVESLLGSPRYGERWARHWLDVVRFGESQGFERNHVRENAWRYRDWVIQAFNRDLPYDEFVRQQVAGDVLRPGDLDALIATGYHVCGTWDQVAHLEGSTEMRTATRFDELEDLVGTLGQSFLGLTIQCARCHDHKFDPISQKEYYQVAATLGGVTQEKDERSRIPLHASREQPGFAGVAHVIVPKQPPPMAVLDRGDYRKPGEVVSPAGLRALSGLSGDFELAPDAPERLRRAALARWLTDPRNPLTARVFVNRIWYQHFGQGLVETPSDFGYNGGRPSHPELLDELASRFMEGGWKTKAMHRLIVTSATYRQTSRTVDARAEAVDAKNRLLWRSNRRRLEGEAVRDAALVVAGALNSQLGGPSFQDVRLNKKGANTNHEFTDPTGEFSETVNRRTIYRLWARSGNHPMLESLDCPDPSVLTPKRTQTTTPIQALSLSNNAFMEKCAVQFAKRVRHEAGDDVALQIELAWQRAFARLPNDREYQVARSFVSRQGLDQLCLVLFNANEFLFIN